MNEIQSTITVRCSVAHAFDVFTTKVDLWWPVSHRRFDHSTLSFDLESARFLETSSDGEEVERGAILTWDRPNQFSYTWHPGAIDKPTTVVVAFESDGDQTVVNVRHQEGEANLGEEWPERAEVFRHAWADVLPRFGTYIEEN